MENRKVLEKLRVLCPKLKRESSSNGLVGYCEPKGLGKVPIFSHSSVRKLREIDLFLCGGWDQSNRDFNKFNSKYGLILNPVAWIRPSRYFIQKSFRKEPLIKFFDQDFERLYTPRLYTKKTTPIEKLFEGYELGTRSHAQKVLTKIEEMFENSSSWAIYGLFEGYGSSAGEVAGNRLMNLLVTLKSLGKKLPKDLVVYVFHSIGNGKGEVSPKIRDELRREGFSVIEKEDQIEVSFSGDLPPIIFLGAVPGSVLNEFLYSSKVIPVIAGQGTRNFMDYNGVPYLSFAPQGLFSRSLGLWNLILPAKRKSELSDLSAAYEVLGSYFGFNYLNAGVGPARKDVEKILINSLEEKNNIKNLFSIYGDKVQKLSHKVVRALEEMTQTLMREGLWSPCKEELSE